MEILKDFAMPAKTATGGKSKWLSTEQLAVINSLKIGEAVIVPFPANTNEKDEKNMNYCVRKAIRANANAENGREYQFALLEGKGIAIKLLKSNEEAAQPVEAEENAE